MRRYEGYIPKLVDVTAYWRSVLKGCKSKHHHPQAGKALQVVELGLISQAGSVGNQRVIALTDLIRGDLDDASSVSFQT